MIIDDEYTDVKDKYFNQAQTKTGVVSAVVKSLNDFVKQYDSANTDMKTKRDKVRKTYVFNSPEYNQQEMDIYNSFNETIASLRETHINQVHEAIQTVKGKISDVITAKIPSDGLVDVTMIRNFTGNLSDDEVKVFLTKYQHSYLVTKAIFGAMAEGQADRIGVKFVSADDILSTIDSIEDSVVKMIRNYNGSVSYDVAVMLNGDHIQTVNDSFESFVSAYKVG